MIYSDGATRGNGKRNNIGAYAYILIYQDQYEEFSEASCDTTNNQQELLGVINALRKIDKLRNVTTLVYTDSKYVCEGITTWINKWKENNWRTADKHPVKNKELWVELDKQVNKFQEIYFRWTPGHMNNGGYNDKVDSLCNRAMDELEQKLQTKKEITQTI
jgi:ribonuclease HI